MLKKIALALMPLALVATSSAKADDGLSVDVASISDANVEIVTNDVDIDVDALSADAGEESEDAIAVCFRRFGYNRRSWGRSYHNSRYSQCYNSCYNYYLSSLLLARLLLLAQEQHGQLQNCIDDWRNSYEQKQ